MFPWMSTTMTFPDLSVVCTIRALNPTEQSPSKDPTPRVDVVEVNKDGYRPAKEKQAREQKSYTAECDHFVFSSW